MLEPRRRDLIVAIVNQKVSEIEIRVNQKVFLAMLEIDDDPIYYKTSSWLIRHVPWMWIN